MNPAISFLLGETNRDGLCVNDILLMDDSALERHHSWVQWAFPTWQPSRFNLTAPILTRADLAPLTPGEIAEARSAVHHLAEHFLSFLAHSDHWRHPNDHNHLRVTRLIQCLRLFKLSDKAIEVYGFVIRATSYSDETRRHWYDALHGDPH